MDDQRRAILARALSLGRTVGEWFDDPGVSGTTAEKRPGFLSLVASCEAHPRHKGVILVLNDARFGRWENADESVYWRFLLDKLGWRVQFCEGDTAQEGLGRKVERLVAASAAGDYSSTLSRNVQRGVKGATERGYWTRPEPFGYRRKVVFPLGRERVLDPGQLKAEDEKVALTPYEPEAAIVRRMFEEYASGNFSIKSLAVWVSRQYPGAEWSRRTVQRILQNVVYLGHVASGVNTAKRGESYSKENAHPAIVAAELFARVEVQMAAKAAAPRSPASEYVLSGLVMCSHCGRPYHGGGYGSHRKDGTRSQFYRCGSVSYDRLTPDCPGSVGTISKHYLEGAVFDTMRKVMASPATQRAIVAAVDRFLETSTRAVAPELESARREVARLERRRQNLLDAIEDGTVERGEVAPKLAAVRTQLEAAKQRQQQLSFRKRQAEAGQTERSELLALASDFSRALEHLKGSELREAVKPWLAGCRFDKVSRELTVAVRRVPAAGPLFSALSPDPEGQDQGVELHRMVIGGRWPR